MQNKISQTLFFIILTFFLFQCQGNKQEESTPITAAQFNIRYLESELSLRGQASFSQGDSIENITPIKIDSGVSFMNSATQERTLTGGLIRYQGTINGKLALPLRFGFKLANEEQAREVSFNMPTVGDFSITSASKENGLELQLSSPLTNEESLLLLFTDSNQEARTILRPGPINNLNLRIPPDALLHFTPGNYRLYLMKSKKIEAIDNGLDYQTAIEYYSKEIEFELKE